MILVANRYVLCVFFFAFLLCYVADTITHFAFT
jgi:hypothetical protein